MFVHVFGAYFGLAVSFVLYRRTAHSTDKQSRKDEANGSISESVSATVGNVNNLLYFSLPFSMFNIPDLQQALCFCGYCGPVSTLVWLKVMPSNFVPLSTPTIHYRPVAWQPLPFRLSLPTVSCAMKTTDDTVLIWQINNLCLIKKYFILF